MLARRLGASGLAVSRLGLARWPGAPGPRRRTRGTSSARSALAGGTLVDTAHGYAGGAAEAIIGDLLGGPDRNEVVLLTKAGISRDSGNRVVDCSRWAMMRQASRRR